MRIPILTAVIIPGLLMMVSCRTSPNSPVDLQVVESEQRVKVTAGGKAFTAYIYDPELEKPVLFPLVTADGVTVTRGFPLAPEAGERADHPHHVGCWLNFGDVNGYDFWNNSPARSQESKVHLGRIVHREFLKVRRGRGRAVLEVRARWMAPDTGEAEQLLEETTSFTFRASEKTRIIDRVTTLTAISGRVTFTDNKEGMMALRVGRAFEHPDTGAVLLTDSSGQLMEQQVVDTAGVTGRYRNSEGVEGTDVWGKRARWVELTGISQGQRRSIVLMDHPSNTGYLSHWHARGYGLFSVNNLGRKVFDNNREEIVVELEQGSSLTFRYRLVLSDEDLSDPEIEALWTGFTEE